MRKKNSPSRASLRRSRLKTGLMRLGWRSLTHWAREHGYKSATVAQVAGRHRLSDGSKIITTRPGRAGSVYGKLTLNIMGDLRDTLTNRRRPDQS